MLFIDYSYTDRVDVEDDHRLVSDRYHPFCDVSDNENYAGLICLIILI